MSFEKIPEGSSIGVVSGKFVCLRGEMTRVKEGYRIVLRLEKFVCAPLSVPVNCVEIVKNC